MSYPSLHNLDDGVFEADADEGAPPNLGAIYHLGRQNDILLDCLIDLPKYVVYCSLQKVLWKGIPSGSCISGLDNTRCTKSAVLVDLSFGA